jgi:predicted GTPase
MDEDDPTDQNIVLVMGLTGAGKSFFINKLTGQNVEEGHKLKSCKWLTRRNARGN